MALSIDILLYLIAAILFGLAGFDVQVSSQGEKRTSIGWQWLAFMVLVVSLIV